MARIWTEKRLVKAETINLAAQIPEKLVALSEEDYRRNIETAAQRILDEGSKIVLLAGPSGCGKTTSANKIAQCLREKGCPAQVISMDDFYLSLEDYPRLPDGTKDYENVTALDIPLVHKCLEELLTKGETQLPVFDFATEMRTLDKKPINTEGGVVIMEGIHALNPVFTEGLENGIYKIYTGVREEYSDRAGKNILTAKQLRLARRCLRDDQRGHSLEKTLYRAPQVNEGEELYIRRFKLQANCVLDTSFSYEPCVLAGQLPHLLRAISQDSPVYGTAQILANGLEQFNPISVELVPQDSMLQEFLR